METPNNMQDILALLQNGQWAPVAALVIGFLIWLTKEGTPTGLRVPPRLRLPLALLLGQATGAVAAITAGVPLRDAIIGGLVATVLSWAGHELGIEGLRGGAELLGGVKASPEKPIVAAGQAAATEPDAKVEDEAPPVSVAATPTEP